jgi:hypothetical protein
MCLYCTGAKRRCLRLDKFYFAKPSRAVCIVIFLWMKRKKTATTWDSSSDLIRFLNVIPQSWTHTLLRCANNTPSFSSSHIYGTSLNIWCCFDHRCWTSPTPFTHTRHTMLIHPIFAHKFVHNVNPTFIYHVIQLPHHHACQLSRKVSLWH